MKRSGIYTIFFIGLVTVTVIYLICGILRQKTSSPVGTIHIDYPNKGTIFPPEFQAPTWIWRDTVNNVSLWKINISFFDGSSIQINYSGELTKPGEIDHRCVSLSNKLPELSNEQKSAHTWVPDSSTWEKIKIHSVNKKVTIAITGHKADDSDKIVSSGQVTIQISSDSVGAPIFYRDVPLMPSENEKGVIKPLSKEAIPLISWKIRNIKDNSSKILMENIHTCANCHSFSNNGKIMGMDMDGPRNDKGLYAIVNVDSITTICNQDLVSWSGFKGKLGSTLRVGFMSQISPDGRYVISTFHDPGIKQSDYERHKDPVDLTQSYYVANFKDYRFLQVFYPTRGILSWYDRMRKKLNNLPGADDTSFVHTNAVWSPDGKYLVFARAKAQDPYRENGKIAQYANDTNETSIQYDLYKLPFNGGKGGKPEPIRGASCNGMSNSFPKISPDGKWIVFVQARNGLLMRPDGQLFIVPADGGTARRMRCNTPLMNSWHSFSPNGRWMVFSSKSRSPYTQMFLTHIDSSGNDSPPVLIENTTAVNRAVNIPEFVNIAPDEIVKIEAPAAEYARHTDLAVEAMKNRQYENAIQEWLLVLSLAPEDSRACNSIGVAMVETGDVDNAIKYYLKAIKLNPQYAEAFNNLGDALSSKGENNEAIKNFQNAVKLNPEYAVAQVNLGSKLAECGQTDKAILHLKKAVTIMPDNAEINRNLGHALAEKKQYQESSIYLEKAVRLSNENDPLALFLLGKVYSDLSRISEAVSTERKALTVAMSQKNIELMEVIKVHLKYLSDKK